MRDARQDLGETGERLAARFLEARGLQLVARRFRTPLGELDLVMRDGATVVFVEVKTRRSRTHAEPHESLRPRQQQHLLRAAQWFLHARKLEDAPCRFDIVGVVLADDAEPQLEHWPDAFTPRR